MTVVNQGDKEISGGPGTTAIAGPERIWVPPCWEIVPPGLAPFGVGRRIVLQPGPGFGDGRHETTQLCLQALSALGPRAPTPWRLLDFGSGSGILSIAGAQLGATVTAVEIDENARAHAAENARINAVAEHIEPVSDLAAVVGRFDIIVGNILRSVLLAHADALISRRAPSGVLILSGLVATDVPEVSAHYAAGLDGRRPEIYARGDWRALVWRATREAG